MGVLSADGIYMVSVNQSVLQITATIDESGVNNPIELTQHQIILGSLIAQAEDFLSPGSSTPPDIAEILKLPSGNIASPGFKATVVLSIPRGNRLHRLHRLSN